MLFISRKNSVIIKLSIRTKTLQDLKKSKYRKISRFTELLWVPQGKGEPLCEEVYTVPCVAVSLKDQVPVTAPRKELDRKGVPPSSTLSPASFGVVLRKPTLPCQHTSLLISLWAALCLGPHLFPHLWFPFNCFLLLKGVLFLFVQQEPISLGLLFSPLHLSVLFLSVLLPQQFPLFHGDAPGHLFFPSKSGSTCHRQYFIHLFVK